MSACQRRVIVICALLLAIVGLSTDKSIAIVGLTGSIWAEATYDSGDPANGPSSMGNIKQGIDWVEVNHYRLNTFASVRYRFRSNNNFYYNAYGPVIGMELSKGPLNIGIQYFWERYTDWNISDDKIQFYINYWQGWDLLRK